MTDVRTENEVKLYADSGPFVFSDDPGPALQRLRSVIAKEGFRCGGASVRKHTDTYYADPGDTFADRGIVLRFRDEGMTGYVTVKIPSIRNGMGLSRREVETRVINSPGFDRMKALEDHARNYLGTEDIDPVPRLIAEITRCEFTAESDVRRYTADFDSVVYVDPRTGARSAPVCELEFESLDEAIADDRMMKRLVYRLTEDYLFDEERMSKYVRGREWIRSLGHDR
ncbi:hypothetical protein AUQ37_06580 [Candidatus Methanomethylophilus sp. 1R26]|uniref:CYTH domain-containing protein n=1 Tax=Candidatus Methanomethylophilus sp. 1R26 TaxID=1769296 RepID=UPI000736DBDF|nr:CYTH domain-containing protein [Candidatus Methanomethylophilus sp. 1R26]KUE74038.1 hypothetical protein AUQ37_06580 [Candidatus Methanomethylophilus sp. 1R26]